MRSSASGRLPSVGIVGAGLSGLACARILADCGWRVRVFDKGRGVGGRMSTRRGDGRSFDHGAQYFTVRAERFERFVESRRRDGVVAAWRGEIAVIDASGTRAERRRHDRYVGVPAMNELCRHLTADLDVALRTRVTAFERKGERWRLKAGELGLGAYDALVVSAPAAQTAALLASCAPEMAARAGTVDMAPCWAVLASFSDRLDTGFDAAFVHDSPLSWVARNNSKPGRPDAEAWLLHGSSDWSRQHLDLDPGEAAARLGEAFRDTATGLDRAPTRVDARLWRFALPVEPLSESCLFDRRRNLGACGDWCGGPRVEGAFLSGCALADRLLDR